MLFNRGVVVIGHRGFGRGCVEGRPENSPESVAAAVAAGLAWVEIDVRRTADDALVLGHDAVTSSGLHVAGCSVEDAVREGLPLLGEVLDGIPPDVGVVLDVKSAMSDALRPHRRTTAALVAPVARAEARRRPVMAYSFDTSALLVLQELAPEVPRGLLTWRDFPISAAVPAAVHLGAQVVTAHTGSFLVTRNGAPDLDVLTTAVETAHDAGLEVVAWCPAPADAIRLAQGGVDAICVDDVPGSLEQLAAAGIPLQLTDRRRQPAG